MKVWKDSDFSQAPLQGLKVAVIGYGNQGHAHAQNLHDSGVDTVVGLRAGSQNEAKARAAGLAVVDIADAVQQADVVMLTLPDEYHGAVYDEILAVHMKPGAALAFAHGFAVHFGYVTARDDIDLILIAPKGPGHQLRTMYQEGLGLICLYAVAQDASGQAEQRAIDYARALGGGRAGILETSFREECETDLFGEQAVLCGGVSNLIKAGFETLVEAGYAPEMAYFECLHEVKLVVDLLHARGLSGMREAISNTAEFGDYVSGERVVADPTRAAMRAVLDDIQSGAFAKRFMDDVAAGSPLMEQARHVSRSHPSEAAGQKLRGLMSWLK